MMFYNRMNYNVNESLSNQFPNSKQAFFLNWIFFSDVSTKIKGLGLEEVGGMEIFKKIDSRGAVELLKTWEY